MRPRLPGTWVREFPDEKPALSAEELYEKYLLKHPRHISDLIFVLEVKAEREIRVP